MEEKVYTPEVIEDAPFPGQDIPAAITQAQPPAGTFTPTTTKEKTFPKRLIATELIGQALNTRSKKILGEFTFTPSGAIQVGDYKNGVSGDLRITPNGLTARDLAGLTTFAIDGTTGDAVFKGTVQAGSVISGSVITGDITVGGEGNGEGEIHVLDDTNVEKITLDKDGMTINTGKLTIKDSADTTIVDATGLVSTANFAADSISQTASFSTTSQTYVDVTSMSLSFTLSRQSKVLIGSSIKGYSPDATSTNIVTPVAQIDLDGSQVAGEMSTPSIVEIAGVYYTTSSTTVVATVAAGSHTLKIQLKSSSGGNVTLAGSRVLWYVVLGK